MADKTKRGLVKGKVVPTTEPVEHKPRQGIHPVGFNGASSGQPTSKAKKVKKRGHGPTKPSNKTKRNTKK